MYKSEETKFQAKNVNKSLLLLMYVINLGTSIDIQNGYGLLISVSRVSTEGKILCGLHFLSK